MTNETLEAAVFGLVPANEEVTYAKLAYPGPNEGREDSRDGCPFR